MCNRLFKYLSENSILYKKQFGFQTSPSTEHAILLLVNQLYQSFDESKFTLVIFIDLSKFLCVLIDENLTWKNHIEVVENKISKNNGVLYRASHLLDFKNLLKIYFYFTHIYINYANPLIANPTKWSNILKQFVGNLPTNCLSVFDHFMNLALKGLILLGLVILKLNSKKS